VKHPIHVVIAHLLGGNEIIVDSRTLMMTEDGEFLHKVHRQYPDGRKEFLWFGADWFDMMDLFEFANKLNPNELAIMAREAGIQL
jgi:hypothetical protein